MWAVSPQGRSPQENRQWRYTHTTHTCFGLLVHSWFFMECMSLANLSGGSTLKELCWCLLCVLLPSTTHASLCFMTVCMFMRGRTRMHIVHGLWGVSLLGSLEGQAGGDCKYSVRVCVCVCAQRHSCGIVSRPAGRHRDNTNTHTVLLLSLYFTLPMTPLFPSLFLPFFSQSPHSPNHPFLHSRQFLFTCWSVWCSACCFRWDSNKKEQRHCSEMGIWSRILTYSRRRGKWRYFFWVSVDG